MALAFLLDENLRGPLWQAILQRNYFSEHQLDAVRVGDMPDLPPSSDDARVLQFAESNTRLLITEDRHSMPGHLHRHLRAGHHSPGVLIPRDNVTMSELFDFLELMSLAARADEIADAVTYFP
jgi:uncharacterized protein DUF5615